MAVPERYQADVERILAHRGDNGGDLWTTADRRILKGGPFSTVECVGYLRELGVDPEEPVLRQAADLIFSTWREDGRFKVYPSGGIYPCQTALAAQALCRLGYAGDPRMRKTFQHFLDIQSQDGGWRCNKFSFGRGPETAYSNPYPTLVILDCFRYVPGYENVRALDRAVEFLLAHWTIRRPIGPCHYGMGTLFMQVEYPFRNYNLFPYVHTLSFYGRARRDTRFQEALAALESRLTDGQVTVQRVVPKLAKLEFCKKGAVSEPATRRYQEIPRNLKTPEIGASP